MHCKVTSQTVTYGRNQYRHNADGSWSALAFGSFGPNQVGLRYGWIHIPSHKVPEEVKKAIA